MNVTPTGWGPYNGQGEKKTNSKTKVVRDRRPGEPATFKKDSKPEVKLQQGKKAPRRKQIPRSARTGYRGGNAKEAIVDTESAIQGVLNPLVVNGRDAKKNQRGTQRETNL